MTDQELEKAFSDYLENEQYDNAEEFLFSIIRNAFLAGWKAANDGRIILLQTAKKQN